MYEFLLHQLSLLQDFTLVERSLRDDGPPLFEGLGPQDCLVRCIHVRLRLL